MARFHLVIPLLLQLGAAAPGEAQLAPRATATTAPIATSTAVFSAPTGQGAGSDRAPEVPLSVGTKTQMMQTIAGPAASRPAFVDCDPSELEIGKDGGAVVMGDTYFYNTGSGKKCPPVGKQLKIPRSLMDARR